MSSIIKKYIWIQIVLVTAIISPVRGQTSANGNETRYTYNAAGQKLRVVHNTAKPNITNAFGMEPAGLTSTQILNTDVTDYLLGGSLVVQNNMTKMLLFDGGYAKAEWIPPTAYGYTLFYYNQDHLGNIREVMNASGNLQQRTNYYPFGGIIADICAEQDFQPYKYNGKELDLMHGLNTYDYGARQYDPILCRWDRVDPLTEKYYSISTYAYCANNPIKSIDPDGKAIETLWDVANVALDATSLVTNVASGNYLSAVVDAGALLVDAAATAVPFVPGGAGAAVKAARTAEKAVNVTKSVDKSADIVNIGKYSNVPNPRNVTSGGKFTPKQKKIFWMKIAIGMEGF